MRFTVEQTPALMTLMLASSAAAVGFSWFFSSKRPQASENFSACIVTIPAWQGKKHHLSRSCCQSVERHANCLTAISYTAPERSQPTSFDITVRSKRQKAKNSAIYRGSKSTFVEHTSRKCKPYFLSIRLLLLWFGNLYLLIFLLHSTFYPHILTFTPKKSNLRSGAE